MFKCWRMGNRGVGPSREVSLCGNNRVSICYIALFEARLAILKFSLAFNPNIRIAPSIPINEHFYYNTDV